MFAFDPVLLEFVGGNWMSLYILITLLKGIALVTPSVKDDQIVTLISGMFKVIRAGKAPMSLDAKAAAAATTAAEAAAEARKASDKALATADEASKIAEEYKNIRLNAEASQEVKK
jgi:hypothetical protein